MQINKLNSVLNQVTKLFRSRLARGAMGSFIIRLSHTFLTLILSILLARILEPGQFGLYSFSLSLITLFAIPAQLGLPQLVVRQISVYQAQDKWSLALGIIKRSQQAVLFISCVVILILLAFVYFFSDKISSLDPAVFLIALALLPLTAYTGIRSGILRGFRHVVIAQIPENIIRHGLFVVVLLASVLIPDNHDINAPMAMFINVVTTLVAFFVGIYFLVRYTPNKVKQNQAEYDTKTWVISVVPFLVVGGMQVINKHTDIIMLGVLADSKSVGIYQVATRGAELVTFALIAVNMAVAPVFARKYAQNDLEGLQKVFSLSCRAMLLYAIPVSLIFIFVGSFILKVVFGAEYQSGSYALAILSVGHTINVGIGSVALLLNMTGHERDTAKGVIIAAITNVILNAIFIPIYGIEGAAIATGISIITSNVLLGIWVYKRLKIKPSIIG